MSITPLTATFAVVNEDDRASAGQRIRERREALGLNVADLAERTGLHRTTHYRIEEGAGKTSTLRQVERCLDELEHEMGMDQPSVVGQVRPIGDPEAGLVTFDVKGPASGFSVVLKGPVTDIEKLEATVLRLIAGMERPTE